MRRATHTRNPQRFVMKYSQAFLWDFMDHTHDTGGSAGAIKQNPNVIQAKPKSNPSNPLLCSKVWFSGWFGP
ncbi:MAG TPA: hypothetical protein PKG95_00380 [Anaerolineaceae bacterium]|nr:hypothetical protein [Anaerolineaceae bacterium]